MLYNIFLLKDFFWYELFLKSSLNFLQYCCYFVFWFIGCTVYGMWELVHKEGWAVLKNWCFWTVVLEKTLESPLDSKEIKPVNPKRNQPWIFIGSVNAEAEAPILWPPNGKNWLLRKDPDAGEDWRQEEKGMTEDKMVGWHHQLNGHEFQQTPEDSGGQRSLPCYSPWDQRVGHGLVIEQQKHMGS